MLDAIPSRRELLAWGLAIVLAVTAVVLARSDRAGAIVTGPTTQVAYIATGENFPDALGAAATAALGLGPVLLVQQNSVPAPTLAELNRLQPPNIVLVGGTAVISNGVKATLEGLGWGPTVTRIAGANRYDTAAQLSLATFPTSGRYPLAVYAGGEQAQGVGSAVMVRSVSLTAPVAGTVIATSTVTAAEDSAGDRVWCSIATGTTFDDNFAQIWESGGTGSGAIGVLAGTRGFDVTAGQNLIISLVCYHDGISETSPILSDSALTAIFVADL